MATTEPSESPVYPSTTSSTLAAATASDAAPGRLPDTAGEDEDVDDEDVIRRRQLTWASIDLEKLISVALSLHSAAKCIKLGEAQHGAWNLVQPLIFDDGTVWVARIPKLRSLQFPRDDEEQKYVERQIAVEVAALRYVRSRTDIPVPEIYYWTTDRHGDGVGLPFTLESFLPGVLLRYIWDDLPDDARSALYKQLAHIYLELSNKCRLPMIGSPRMNAPRLTECTTKAGDYSEFVMGKVFFPGADNEDDCVGRPTRSFGGPYRDARECLYHEATLSVEDARTEVFGSIHNIDTCAIRWILRSLLPQIYDASHATMDSHGFALFTGDFNLHNILVDTQNADHPVITGLLDWDFANTMPNTEFTEFPLFLQSDATWERDDPGYERINADQAVFLAHLRAEEETTDMSIPLTNAMSNSRLSQLIRTAMFDVNPTAEEEIWDRVYGEEDGKWIALEMIRGLKTGLLQQKCLQFEKDVEVRKKIWAVMADAGEPVTPRTQTAEEYLELIGDIADLAEERCYLQKVIGR